MELSTMTGIIQLDNGVSFDATLVIEVAKETATVGKIVSVSGCDGYSKDILHKRINLANGVIFLPGPNASFSSDANEPVNPD